MRILDLCCCAGGAAMGYKQAGFDEVVGVDKRRHVHYPFELHQGDAVDLLRYMLEDPSHNEFDATRNGKGRWYVLRDFDAIHGSPPCQAHSPLSQGSNQHYEYKDIIGPMRELLNATQLPWVMENVPEAPLRRDLELCGEMFGLRVIRHRIFEFGGGFTMPQLPHLPHKGGVRGYRGKTYRDGYYYPVHGSGGGKGTVKEWQDAMGIHWTKARVELAEAIPPAYTKHIGGYLLDHLELAA